MGKTITEHLKNLDDVLSSLANNGIILQINKCKLFREETEFLGHQISKNGIQPIKKNIEAMINIKNPDNLKKIRSLVGKFNYYAKFIPKHAEIMAPLSELIKGHSEDRKDTPITLTNEAREAIDIMKAKLTQAPILAYPNFYGDPFIVTTDASFTGISYIISQMQNEKERVICYGSRKLSPT